MTPLSEKIAELEGLLAKEAPTLVESLRIPKLFRELTPALIARIRALEGKRTYEQGLEAAANVCEGIDDGGEWGHSASIAARSIRELKGT